MTTIDRYILKEFAKTFCLVVVSLAAIYLIVDFFERIRMFASNRATPSQICAYFVFSIPMILSQMLPVGVLLSSLITFGLFSKHSELTAMKATGISIYRAGAPIIAIAAVIALFSFFLNEYITPHANQQVKHVKHVEIQKRQQSGTFTQNQIWYRAKDGIYNFDVFDPVKGIVRGIRINYLDAHMRIIKRIDAKEAVWINDAWIFYDVLITTFPQDGFPVVEKKGSSPVDLPEKPSDFMIVQKDTDEMGYGELKGYIQKLQREGYDTTRYRADLYGKIAFPVVSVILGILGICFSSRAERSGGVVQSMGIGIVLGLSYWIVFAFTISLGRSGAMPPLLAAWSANALLGFLALFMFLRIRT